MSTATKISRPRLAPGSIVRWTAIAFALFWSLAPIYWMLSTSLKTELEATRLHPTLWPEAPTFANYIGLTGTSLPFVAFFFNTVLSCLLTAVVCVVIATPAAYALSGLASGLPGRWDTPSSPSACCQW